MKSVKQSSTPLLPSGLPKSCRREKHKCKKEGKRILQEIIYGFWTSAKLPVPTSDQTQYCQGGDDALTQLKRILDAQYVKMQTQWSTGEKKTLRVYLASGWINNTSLWTSALSSQSYCLTDWKGSGSKENQWVCPLPLSLTNARAFPGDTEVLLDSQGL